MVNRPTTTGGKKYDKFFVYVPTEVAKDSAFPFRAGEVVEIEVDARKKQLTVRRPKGVNSLHPP